MLSALAALMASGTLTFFPSTSIDTAAIVVQTSAGCPSTADAYYAIATGHGFPKDGQVVTAPTAAGMSRTEGFNVFFAQTMKDFAADNGTTLQGRYDVSVYCVDSFTGTRYAQFDGKLTFSSPTKYQASGRNTGTQRPTVPVAEAAPASEAAPTPVETTAVVDAAPAATTSKNSLPVGWIAGAVAAILLAFETGRRLGRRSATTRP
ncbi:hypothetical protein [Paractinoplanes durhamensis]|uniref:Secreted protein n=1 Tax=Paractinoplanes durhamensis TaxID=113563 RepID=A0ABQ3Z840_9ACTN|nr:hypothetical protein [Actinoplanes durhamensis]GIE05985.1 hypothetical protein Adu01nite_73350 [Actinoplanes durhamensis]